MSMWICLVHLINGRLYYYSYCIDKLAENQVGFSNFDIYGFNGIVGWDLMAEVGYSVENYSEETGIVSKSLNRKKKFWCVLQEIAILLIRNTEYKEIFIKESVAGGCFYNQFCDCKRFYLVSLNRIW